MHPETMEKRIGDKAQYKYYGRARLSHYRLSFTTKTPEWENEPVSDITVADRFAVYGVVYRMTEEAFSRLAPHEPTYQRQACIVDIIPEEFDFRTKELKGQTEERKPVEVYEVLSGHKLPEDVPNEPYLSRIISAANERRLPPKYVQALKVFVRSWRRRRKSACGSTFTTAWEWLALPNRSVERQRKEKHGH